MGQRQVRMPEPLGETNVWLGVIWAEDRRKDGEGRVLTALLQRQVGVPCL